MDYKQDYEEWRKLMYQRIDELINTGNIAHAVHFSLSQNLIDFPLGIYEKAALKENHPYKAEFRKNAGKLANKYGLFKRAMDNYKSAPDKKILNLYDRVYKEMNKTMNKNNMITKEIIFVDLKRGNFSNFFYRN